LTAGLCRVPSCPGWELSADELFETVQGYVRQQRRQYTSYKVANLPIEFSSNIPRAHLRPGYGDGFRGAPLETEPPGQRSPGGEQGGRHGTSRTTTTHGTHGP
jgi:hypothetical protein